MWHSPLEWTPSEAILHTQMILICVKLTLKTAIMFMTREINIALELSIDKEVYDGIHNQAPSLQTCLTHPFSVRPWLFTSRTLLLPWASVIFTLASDENRTTQSSVHCDLLYCYHCYYWCVHFWVCIWTGWSLTRGQDHVSWAEAKRAKLYLFRVWTTRLSLRGGRAASQKRGLPWWQTMRRLMIGCCSENKRLACLVVNGISISYPSSKSQGSCRKRK